MLSNQICHVLFSSFALMHYELFYFLQKSLRGKYAGGREGALVYVVRDFNCLLLSLKCFSERQYRSPKTGLNVIEYLTPKDIDINMCVCAYILFSILRWHFVLHFVILFPLYFGICRNQILKIDC